MTDICYLYIDYPSDTKCMGVEYHPIYHPERGWLDWTREVHTDLYRLGKSGKECLLIISTEELNELDTRVHCRQGDPLDFRVHRENRIYEFLWISALEASEAI